MNYTTNYNLRLPEPTDNYTVEDANENARIVDEELKKRATLDESGKVPADQIPELDYEASGSAAAVQKALEAHVDNKENPHGVTAEQVGAYEKAQMWDATVAEMLGLGAESVPKDGFMALALPEGKFAVKVTVLTPGGKPFPGITVSGITTRSGTAAVTKSDGTVLGFATNQNVTLTVKNLWLDIAADVSKSQQLTAGVVNSVTLQFERVSEHYKTFNSSTTVRLSPDVVTFNASAAGGGADGTSGDLSSSKSGNGGNGGEVKNIEDISNDGNPIDIVVGAKAGTSSVGSYISARGAYGATGGRGAYVTEIYEPGQDIKFVLTQSTIGSDAPVKFLHPPTPVGGAGGGGGIDYFRSGYQGSAQIDYGSSGGLDGGGRGGQGAGYAGDPNGQGKDGSEPGAGGGGSGTHNYGSSSNNWAAAPGEGQPGLCGLEWRYVDA